jgi:hypothetical protein
LLGSGLLALAIGLGRSLESYAVTGAVGDSPTFALIDVTALVDWTIQRRETAGSDDHDRASL